VVKAVASHRSGADPADDPRRFLGGDPIPAPWPIHDQLLPSGRALFSARTNPNSLKAPGSLSWGRRRPRLPLFPANSDVARPGLSNRPGLPCVVPDAMGFSPCEPCPLIFQPSAPPTFPSPGTHPGSQNPCHKHQRHHLTKQHPAG